MHRYDPARQRLAFGLAGLAGMVDATGFVVAGGYFTSFMSGNTTRMGVHLVEQPMLALLPFGLIACFLMGVTGGAVVRRRAAGRHKRSLMGLVTVLLAGAAGWLAAGLTLPFLAFAAAAMGLSNNVFSRDGEVTVGVTYMTGALVRFGQGLAARIGGEVIPGARGYGFLWLALATGAVAGSALCVLDIRIAAFAATGIALALLVAARRIEAGQR